MEEIKLLIEELQGSEKERDMVLKNLETVIDDAVQEMIEILYSLYSRLARENLTVRSYKGNIFPLEDGIVVYSKGIEEKIILTAERRLFHYQVKNEQLVSSEISPDILLNQIGSDKIYSNLRDMLKERIRLNKEDIMNFKSQASKIIKYAKEFHEDIDEHP